MGPQALAARPLGSHMLRWATVGRAVLWPSRAQLEAPGQWGGEQGLPSSLFCLPGHRSGHQCVGSASP